ncbi:hypothetical protein [Pleionea sediminis]|uniref:hypothetical protein n=1 Tax=Pleionea sediminis TaxID=2569479 RepID=UPI001184DB6A|nr:hypothetical protein [Pleionea sediminis]
MLEKLSLVLAVLSAVCIGYAKWWGIFDLTTSTPPSPNDTVPELETTYYILITGYGCLGLAFLTGLISTLRLGSANFKYSGLITSFLVGAYLAYEILKR